MPSQLPYQLVPSAIKDNISILAAVVVMVGAVPPDHLTLVNVAAPNPVDGA